MTVQTTVLKNGITVATQRFDSVESVSVGAWFKAGTRNEHDHEHGIAHMLEHMAFKGTATRSARDLAEAIENVGGDINAATSVETTSFFVRVLRQDTALAIDVLADILQNSRFDADELEREKHVVLQELGAAIDTPDDVVFDRFTETAFRHQPVGRSILGTRDTIGTFTSDMIRAYIDREYSGERMVLAATGAVDHDEIVKMAEQRFSTMKPAADGHELGLAHYVGGDYREQRPLQDTQVVLGFEGRAYHVRDYYCSQVLAMLLGGAMSSRLFQEVREKHGLCYSIYAFHWGFSDTGVFGVHAATEPGDLPKLLELIIGELSRAAYDIDESELDRARAQFRASLLMSGESAPSRAGQIARQILLFGRPIPNEELLLRLDNLTVSRLRDLAGRIFVESAPTVSAVGPVDSLMDMDDIRARLIAGAPQRGPMQYRRAAAG
ncbi:MAG: insulinase family protein [Roseitalea sp.]|jgi:predicted Zn-dependent peptidase|nr:insulinase family protein [Roseitalea sp.]MBO6721978.1 insulinase family protein [Roseitalea sp.]MBO6743416.1 insulinase family protein [Roseitalea sp.]